MLSNSALDLSKWDWTHFWDKTTQDFERTLWMATKSQKNGAEKCDYTKLPLKSIEIVDRPEIGQEHKVIFFNPRDLASFSDESMVELRQSIRTDELLKPLVVREVKNGRKTVYQLLAGERRYRTLSQILEGNLYCYASKVERPAKWRAQTVVISLGTFAHVVKQIGDNVEIELWDENDKPTGEIRTVDADALDPTLVAKKVHANVPCKIIRNCSDERAMRIAMTENEHQQALTTAEEITVVERLILGGIKQDQVCYMMSKNVTWVSQTASFRNQLPEEAFDKLADGTMMRHVAVNLLSYKAEDRKELFDATIVAEEKETAAKILEHQMDVDAAKDEAEMLEHDAKQAEAVGDDKVAKQSLKKAASADKKAIAFGAKRDKAQADSGKIQQGHVHSASAATDISPKKAKVLPRAEIQKCFVDNVKVLLKDGDDVIDPLCEKIVSNELLNVVMATANAILIGKRDPLDVIRSVKIDAGMWTDPTEEVSDNPCVDGDADSDGEFDPDTYGDSYDPHEDEAGDLMDSIVDGVYDDDDDDP